MNAPGPLIPGFNPDPSIVLVDGWYYLVTSTFEYLPGIPVYRSANLLDWEQVGNVITRPEQLDLRGVPTPGGVWAPTIRHRDGVFHVIVTVMFAPQGCVVFTADDPAGPWSDGTRIGVVDGIDPDLVWDDDGTALVTFAAIGRGIQQVAVDLGTGEALEQVRPLWSGSGLYAPEGPHVHRHGDLWYLLVAEGGTDRGHAVSVARGPSPRGPFTGDPANPVLSARSTGFPVQNLGHADLVETPDGGTAAGCWACVRSDPSRRSHRSGVRPSSLLWSGSTAGSALGCPGRRRSRQRAPSPSTSAIPAPPWTMAGSPPVAFPPRSRR